MPAPQLSKELHAFCHEHHVEMKLNPSLASSVNATAQTLTYTCTEPDCPIHYNIFRGYFDPGHSQKGNSSELGMVPNVRCLHDGTPMYLAELDPEKRSYRLWICPHCDGRRTNEEDLIGLGRDKIQNGPDVSRVQS